MTTSPLDPIAELRRTRPVAPESLRLRVRAIAEDAPETTPAGPGRRLTWRRAIVVLVPAVLAVVVGGIVFSRGGGGNEQLAGREAGSGGAATAAPQRALEKQQHVFGAVTTPSVGSGALDSALAPAPSTTRIQDYDASLRLKLKDADALSSATKRALAVARSLGGFASSVDVNVEKGEGDASIRLRVPVRNVQKAVARLSDLGTIVGESLAIRDLQAGVNAVDRRIARLQKQLRDLRAQEQTPEIQRRIAALTQQVERLQRSRASTVRDARLATVQLDLTTREAAKPKPRSEPGPLHGAWTALTWIGIGALYALIVGGPFLLLALVGWLGWRWLRRRRERDLLGVT